MSKMMLISRDQIDDELWNKCVLSSDSFRHYALTHYLDAACDKWLGLTDSDYSWVWPVPIKNWPVSRVFQPLLAQQLGPYGKDLSDQMVKDGLNFLFERFAHLRIKFNDKFTKDAMDGEIGINSNYELDLIKEYSPSIYNRTVISNLKKSKKSGLIIRKNEAFDSWAIKAFKSYRGKQIEVLDNKFYSQVESIFLSFSRLNEAIVYTAILTDEKVAQAYVLKTNNRLLLLFSAANDSGKQIGAMHAIIDQIIQDYSSQPFVLDFEGSNEDGLAYFYGGFGAEQRIYLQCKKSRLKWPLNRILK